MKSGKLEYGSDISAMHTIVTAQPWHKLDHITLILACLHWLADTPRIDFKILLIPFKTSMHLVPRYDQRPFNPT